MDLLKSGGRLCVLSFHSIEDRVVKRFIRCQEKPEKEYDLWPLPVPKIEPRLISVGKPFRALESEKFSNPRSRSAILRVAERTSVK